MSVSSRTQVPISPRERYGRSRDDEIGRGSSALLAIVARARDERALHSGAAHDGDRFLHRHDIPGVVAVVHMRIEDRQRLLCLNRKHSPARASPRSLLIPEV